jgi:hypothetical protein
MKKSELKQLIKEEIDEIFGENTPQHIYDALLNSYNKTEEWLTQNISTSQSVEIKRAFNDAFEKLQNVLLKSKNSKDFNL